MSNSPCDIYSATYILFIINRMLGAAPYTLTDPPNRKYKVKKPFIIIGAIKMALIFALMVYSIITVKEKAFIGNIKTCFNIFCCMLSICFILFSILRAKYVIQAFKLLYKVDEIFKSLGIFISYEQVKKRISIHVGVVLVFFVMILITIYFLPDDISVNEITTFVSYIPQVMIIFVEVQYFNYLHIAMCRFKLLNEYLETLETDKYLFADASKVNVLDKSTIKDRKLSAGVLRTSNVLSTSYSILETISDLHIQLTDMCTLFNKAFSIQLLFRVTSSLIGIIFFLFYFILNFQRQYNDKFENFEPIMPLIIIFTCIFFITELYILARISDMTCQEANNCPLMLHNIKHQCTDPEILDAIELYSIQMYHNKLQFTVCGLFPIDHTLLYSMTGAATTYLIFLVQFSKSKLFMDVFAKANNLTLEAF